MVERNPQSKISEVDLPDGQKLMVGAMGGLALNLLLSANGNEAPTEAEFAQRLYHAKINDPRGPHFQFSVEDAMRNSRRILGDLSRQLPPNYEIANYPTKPGPRRDSHVDALYIRWTPLETPQEPQLSQAAETVSFMVPSLDRQLSSGTRQDEQRKVDQKPLPNAWSLFLENMDRVVKRLPEKEINRLIALIQQESDPDVAPENQVAELALKQAAKEEVFNSVILLVRWIIDRRHLRYQSSESLLFTAYNVFESCIRNYNPKDGGAKFASYFSASFRSALLNSSSRHPTVPRWLVELPEAVSNYNPHIKDAYEQFLQENEREPSPQEWFGLIKQHKPELKFGTFIHALRFMTSRCISFEEEQYSGAVDPDTLEPEMYSPAVRAEEIKGLDTGGGDEFDNIVDSIDLAELIGTLSPRERGVILHRYVDDESQEEIAKRYGLSRERIRQIEMKGLRGMRREEYGARRNAIRFTNERRLLNNSQIAGRHRPVNTTETVSAGLESSEPKAFPIYLLHLPIHIMWALRAHEIQSIEQLSEMTSADLRNIDLGYQQDRDDIKQALDSFWNAYGSNSPLAQPLAVSVKAPMENSLRSERNESDKRGYAASRLADLEERRRKDPIFALIPPGEYDRSITIRAVNLLGRAGIKTVADLASLTDREARYLSGFKPKGQKTTEYLLYMRELARKQNMQTELQPEG